MNKQANELELNEDSLQDTLRDSEAQNALDLGISENVVNDFVEPQTDKSESEQGIESVIDTVNNRILYKVLSPEITKNENVKRIHKSILIGLLTLFIVIQFIAVLVLSLRTFNYAFTNGSNEEIVNSFLKYLTGYITSVVAELFVILKYIVHNVFDTSITDLVKVFKE